LSLYFLTEHLFSRLNLFHNQFETIYKKGKRDMSKREEDIEIILKNIRKMISTMSHGSITITIHNERVIQIEKNEKIRIQQ